MRLQEEIRELEQRFAQAPDSRLFLPLADALRRAGELERAAKLCREGLQRYPDFNSARILLGETLAELGELDEAVRELEQAAALDAGSSRIKTLLSSIAGKMGAGQAEGDELSGEQVEPSADEPGEQKQGAAGAEPTNEAGEMFVTHTLGDIYRMQGHDLKALEVYRKLLDEGHDDPVLKRKADELARKLAGSEAAGGPDEPAAGVREVQPAPAGVVAPPAGGEGPFEERIDAIFHFLLGDSPEHAEMSAPAASPAAAAGKDAAGSGSGDFVDMLEEWVGDLKRGM